MKWYDALFQWLFKTVLLITCIILSISGFSYFVNGGDLIADNSIPISALINCLFIPSGLLGAILVIAYIIWTEKPIGVADDSLK